jgi:amino acid transporter
MLVETGVNPPEMRLSPGWYFVAYMGLYFAWSFVHWATKSTDEQGHRYIYPVLDWCARCGAEAGPGRNPRRSHRWKAAILSLVATLVVAPATHFMFAWLVRARNLSRAARRAHAYATVGDACEAPHCLISADDEIYDL